MTVFMNDEEATSGLTEDNSRMQMRNLSWMPMDNAFAGVGVHLRRCLALHWFEEARGFLSGTLCEQTVYLEGA